MYKNNNNVLIHYGVKGMKWGVRHDPERIGRKRKTNAKKWLKRGAIIVASGLAVYGSYKLYQSGQINKMISVGKDFITKSKIKESELLRVNEKVALKAYEKLESITSNTNPGMLSDSKIAYKLNTLGADSLTFEESLAITKDYNAGRLTNCGHCTAYIDLQTRGDYSNYKAGVDKGLNGLSFSDISGLYKRKDGAPVKFLALKPQHNTVVDLERSILRQGEGTKGYLSLFTSSKQGHDVFYSINGGKLSIHDGQYNKSYKSLEDYFKDGNDHFQPILTVCLKTDNLEPDIDAMLNKGIIVKR